MKATFATAVIASIAAVSAQGVTSLISAPGSAPSGCSANVAGTFGIQIVAESTAAVAKRAVTQISDGQIQATSAATAQAVTQISDGQIQATSAAAAKPVSQISDGQIQATSAAAAQPVTQISDGQIQAATSTKAANIVTVTVTTTKNNCVATPITQITDGQIQAPAATTTTAASAVAVSQISDGQIQATSKAASAAAVSQITDGQIQASSKATTLVTQTTSAGASTGTSSAGYALFPGAAQACYTSGTLAITLKNGVLTDERNRTGYIAANSQFQFDDPPQTGAIYTAGWSVCSNGTLALGGDVTFYQCLSGDFYNIYYDNVLGAAQCEAVQIEVIQLNSC